MIRRLLRPLKPLYLLLEERLRRHRVRVLVAQLKTCARTREEVMPIVARLHAVWGNASFTADVGFLDEMVQRVLRSRGPFLDCGSGISTVVLAALGTAQEETVWSLEQDEQWYEEMREMLEMLDLRHVRLLHAPLAVTGNATWYTVADGEFPPHFPLVVCDGPSVRRAQWEPEVFHSWRAGVVPELRRHGVTFDTIILDDAHDKRCAALMDAWRRAGLSVEMVETPTGSHVVAHHAGSAVASGQSA